MLTENSSDKQTATGDQTVLIADDEDSIRLILARAVEKMGLKARCVSNGKAALDALKSSGIGAAIIDVRMPELSGLEILGHSAEFAAETPVIVMTAQDTMENAVTAMKNGAFDYITKPFDLDEIRILIERALENARLKTELSALKRSVPDRGERHALIGGTRGMQGIFKTIGKVADQDVTVLIQGESGTGKELIARAIHSSGRRSNQAFVAVNCAAIPDNLLESELFGFKKGAFTGAVEDKIGFLEQADGGTIFLDEIGEMPANLQVKILRFLQDKTVQRLGDPNVRTLDVRVIAATNRDLKTAVAKEVFREDLYFRLNVVPIAVPPLSERREDIPRLTQHFLAKYGALLANETKRFSPDAVDYFSTRDWPGNVRELENAVKRVLVLARGDVVTAAEARGILSGNTDVPDASKTATLDDLVRLKIRAAVQALADENATDLYGKLLVGFEKPLISAALEMTRGNQLKAAELLGLNRNTLRKKIRVLKLN